MYTVPLCVSNLNSVHRLPAYIHTLTCSDVYIHTYMCILSDTNLTWHILYNTKFWWGKTLANTAEVPLHFNALMIFGWESSGKFTKNNQIQ